MNLGSLLENQEIEKRIAITPEIVKKYISLGFNIYYPKVMEFTLGIKDEDYKNLGVNFANDEEIIKSSNIIIQLGLPDEKNYHYLEKTKL